MRRLSSTVGPQPARFGTLLFLLMALMAALVALEAVRGHTLHSMLMLPIAFVPMIAAAARRGLADEVWMTDTELVVVCGRLRASVPLLEIEAITVQPWGNVVTLRLLSGHKTLGRQVRFLAPPRRGGGRHFIEQALCERLDSLRRQGR